MASLGYKGIPLDALIRMRDHGVDPGVRPTAPTARHVEPERGRDHPPARPRRRSVKTACTVGTTDRRPTAHAQAGLYSGGRSDRPTRDSAFRNRRPRTRIIDRMHLIAFIGRPCEIRHIIQGQLLPGVLVDVDDQIGSRPVNTIWEPTRTSRTPNVRSGRLPIGSPWNQRTVRYVSSAIPTNNSADPTLPKK